MYTIYDFLMFFEIGEKDWCENNPILGFLIFQSCSHIKKKTNKGFLIF